jgi:hypothetical protein
MSKPYHLDGDYEDSNDSLGASKDASFTEKDFSGRSKQSTNRVVKENLFLQQCLDYIHRILSR